jgi:hypothetical protein
MRAKPKRAAAHFDLEQEDTEPLPEWRISHAQPRVEAGVCMVRLVGDDGGRPRIVTCIVRP